MSCRTLGARRMGRMAFGTAWYFYELIHTSLPDLCTGARSRRAWTFGMLVLITAQPVAPCSGTCVRDTAGMPFASRRRAVTGLEQQLSLF